jgi:glycosyltransferase involved in cell wall biosynthesis
MHPKIQVESFYTNRFMPSADDYKNTSFITFQRAATLQQYKMIQHLKSTVNIPVIYEIDDDLMDIPKWNYASGFYAPFSSTIKNIFKLVDGIITSTDYLKRKYFKYNKNIQVIPNHLPKCIWGETTKCSPTDINKTKIVYSGSFNHFNGKGSGGDFSKELIQFISNTTDKYDWVFVGGIPYEFKNDTRITIYSWKSVMEFPHFIKSLKPDIMLAPLEDNDFNKCKSNIKALESIACGSPLICSDIEPYKNLTCKCKTSEFMIHQIEMLSSNPQLRQNVWEKDYNILKKQLYWEENNNLIDFVNKYLKLVNKKI